MSTEDKFACRIAHISDLHFCEPELVERLQRFSELSEKKFGVQLDIEYCLPNQKAALAEALTSLDPDVLIASGDITTFGDRKSFDAAAEWFGGVISRKENRSRRVVVVPGNHDVLGAQIQSLLGMLAKMDWYVRWPLEHWLREILAEVDNCLKTASISREASSDPFAEFNRFVRSHNEFSANSAEIPIDAGSAILIAPFNSVSSDPLWMNLGEHRKREEKSLCDRFSPSHIPNRGLLRIAVMHHNPISSPNVTEANFVNAYNSMPGGTEFLKRLQSRGADLILHGHQHEEGVLLFDYDLSTAGHAFCVGARSSTAIPRAGFNLIDVENVNQVTLTPHEFDGTGFQKTPSSQLCLERHRPGDTTTHVVRFEVKKYLSGIADDEEGPLWDEIYKQGIHADLFYISGRHLRHLRAGRHPDLTKLLENTKVRILLSDPEFLRKIAATADSPDEASKQKDEESLSGIWGGQETLKELIVTATQVRDWFEKSYLATLSQKQRENLDIRLAQTLLPFGATVVDADKAWGKMVLRLLPVGAVGDLANPVLKLNRRSSDTLYDYYLEYLRKLIKKAKRFAGNWSHGDADLSVRFYK